MSKIAQPIVSLQDFMAIRKIPLKRWLKFPYTCALLSSSDISENASELQNEPAVNGLLARIRSFVSTDRALNDLVVDYTRHHRTSIN